MQKMNKIISTIAIVLLLSFYLTGCREEGRIDHLDSSVVAPAAPTLVSVSSRPGGAVIRFSIPDDDNILGVMANYMRNGKECWTQASRYTDSLVVEGYGNTDPQDVTLYSFAVNKKLSEGVKTTIIPLTPPVRSVEFELSETFGGILVTLRNNLSETDLSAVLMIDTLLVDSTKAASDIRWTDLHTFHTSSKEIKMPRRGIDPVKNIFGVYLRDRYGNYSDTLFKVLTPIEEIELPRSSFKNGNLPTDYLNYAEGNSNYRIENLWDGTNTAFMATSHQGPIPQWFTIDLGYKASISRITKWPRANYELYSGTAPRTLEVWGSTNPNPDGSWDDTWHLLGKFEQFKPSGYGEGSQVGTITDEDKDYWYNKTEWELIPTDDVPDPYQVVSYVRIKTTSTFGTYGTDSQVSQVIIGELFFWGQVKE